MTISKSKTLVDDMHGLGGVIAQNFKNKHFFEQKVQKYLFFGNYSS